MQKQEQNKERKKDLLGWAKFLLRWGIAVVGIGYVISQIFWYDRILVWPSVTFPNPTLAELTTEDALDTDFKFDVLDANGKVQELQRDSVWSQPDSKKTQVTENGKKEFVVGVDLDRDAKSANRILVADTPTSGNVHIIDQPASVNYQVTVPHPLVNIGVIRLVRKAKLIYLLLALAVFPVTIIITSIRWHELMKPLDIHIPLRKAFELNMVGLFYNTFLLGSTGGDVLKAYYVASWTHHRTRAVMSVIVDRVIGLLALILLGGIMASLQWKNPMCRTVALASAGILTCTAIGLVFFYNDTLRKYSGLDFILRKLPMQKMVTQAIETMHIYGKRPMLVLGSLLGTLPVHSSVVTAAMLCGFAFNLPIAPFYYWTAVPVICLSASIPISPQGAGVMEYFAITLLVPPANIAQAFALTLSIRVTQILWNLAGGVVVLRGGYHSPSQSEQTKAEQEDEDHGELGNPIANDGKPPELGGGDAAISAPVNPVG
jgi:hypothetical protein